MSDQTPIRAGRSNGGPGWFFTIGLPIVWGMICVFNFRSPGDEYGGWGVGSLAGLWWLLLVPSLHIGNAPLGALPAVLFGGMLTMSLLGMAMDKLRCSKRLWLIVWLVAAALLTLNGLAQFESYSRAMAKNGSLAAYILPSLNLSLTAVCLLMILSMAPWRAIQWRRALRTG